LLGNSSGQFDIGVNIPLSWYDPYAGIRGFALAGSTNDGNDLDLVVTNDQTTIFLGDGNGGFSIGPTYALSGPVYPEAAADGKTNLLFDINDPLGNIYFFTLVTGNGDGTFNAIPTLTGGSTVTADLNGDGLTDLIELQASGTVLAGALSLGDGRFGVLDQGTSIPVTANIILAGDFNGDGKADAVAIFPGMNDPMESNPPQDAELYFFQGNGNGTFQPAGPAFDLSPGAPQHLSSNAVTGDFNGDGKLDVVYAWSGSLSPEVNASGLVLLPGHGDGTFEAPITVDSSSSTGGTPVLAADLNMDGKTDLIWNGNVYLSKGDGTFSQQPLNLPSGLGPFPLLAIGDLNGDGVPDIVSIAYTAGGALDGIGVFAGKGDGTFSTTPFFTIPNVEASPVLIGDVNGDGHPDLLLESAAVYNSASPLSVSVFLGDGTGNFTADSNHYYSGALTADTETTTAVLGRFNNQAPALPNDHALDFLTYSNGGATVLLNQTNPAPTAPTPVGSATSLTVALSGAAPGQPFTVAYPGQPLTFTVAIFGSSPTGIVTFTSGSTTVGTAVVTGKLTTFQVSFDVGTYSVIASYGGDEQNTSSVSNAVSIPVTQLPTTTSLAASASTAGVNQQLTFTATVSGYEPTGNVTFTAGNATLGTVAVSNFVATLQTSFSVAGSYAVVASYAGDVNNIASVSSAVPITVTAPSDFAITASPTSATITDGQSATTTITITPTGGYSGTVNFSCGVLPSKASCTFSSASVVISGGKMGTTKLTVSTTASTTSLLQKIAGPLQGIALACILGLAFSPKRMWEMHRRLIGGGMLLLLAAAGLTLLSACGSSSHATTTVPGTPTGAQTITVSAADSAGGPSHTFNFTVTIQ
jgi:hypothetical protein